MYHNLQIYCYFYMNLYSSNGYCFRLCMTHGQAAQSPEINRVSECVFSYTWWEATCMPGIGPKMSWENPTSCAENCSYLQQNPIATCWQSCCARENQPCDDYYQQHNSLWMVIWFSSLYNSNLVLNF